MVDFDRAVPARGPRLGIVLLLVAIGVTASCGFRTIDTGHVGVTTLFGRSPASSCPRGCTWSIR